MRLPSLGFHFSPARYHRLMQVIQLFQAENVDGSDVLRPWSQADLEGWLSLLVWKVLRLPLPYVVSLLSVLLTLGDLVSLLESRVLEIEKLFGSRDISVWLALFFMSLRASTVVLISNISGIVALLLGIWLSFDFKKAVCFSP